VFWDILIAASLVTGAFFALVGSYGLIKLNDPMSRLHAPTKASTLGVGGILLASIVNSFVYGDGSLHELLVMAFIFVTAPISAHFIAKAHIHSVVRREDLPRPQQDDTWAVLDAPPEVGPRG
jgi:multicomponent K+:H+ antiporter subunit G